MVKDMCCLSWSFLLLMDNLKCILGLKLFSLSIELFEAVPFEQLRGARILLKRNSLDTSMA